MCLLSKSHETSFIEVIPFDDGEGGFWGGGGGGGWGAGRYPVLQQMRVRDGVTL